MDNLAKPTNRALFLVSVAVTGAFAGAAVWLFFFAMEHGIDYLWTEIPHALGVASPELAASIDGTVVDTDRIAECTELLMREYDHVLIEGAGGLMVPLKGDYLTIDYIRDHNLPVVLVTNATLGSINHTLLALNAISTYGLKLFAVVFNHHFDNDKPIAEDTHRYVKSWVERHNPDTLFIDVESLT